MHILSAADAGGNHQPMAMTAGSGNSPGMSVGMPMQTAELAAASYPVSATQSAAVPAPACPR